MTNNNLLFQWMSVRSSNIYYIGHFVTLNWILYRLKATVWKIYVQLYKIKCL